MGNYMCMYMYIYIYIYVETYGLGIPHFKKPPMNPFHLPNNSKVGTRAII